MFAQVFRAKRTSTLISSEQRIQGIGRAGFKGVQTGGDQGGYV